MVDHDDINHAGLAGVAGAVGYVPVAYPLNFSEAAALTTAVNLVANGGSIAVPMLVPGTMRLNEVTVRNTDTGTARTWGWDLYQQVLSGDNPITRVAACNANESFTPGGSASTRGIVAASAPIVIDPGIYWLVIQNRHATNTFGVASTATGHAFGPNNNQQKTTTNPNGATLDMVAATWTKDHSNYGVWLRGLVFNEATVF